MLLARSSFYREQEGKKVQFTNLIELKLIELKFTELNLIEMNQTELKLTELNFTELNCRVRLCSQAGPNRVCLMGSHLFLGLQISEMHLYKLSALRNRERRRKHLV